MSDEAMRERLTQFIATREVRVFEGPNELRCYDAGGIGIQDALAFAAYEVNRAIKALAMPGEQSPQSEVHEGCSARLIHEAFHAKVQAAAWMKTAQTAQAALALAEQEKQALRAEVERGKREAYEAVRTEALEGVGQLDMLGESMAASVLREFANSWVAERLAALSPTAPIGGCPGCKAPWDGVSEHYCPVPTSAEWVASRGEPAAPEPSKPEDRDALSWKLAEKLEYWIYTQATHRGLAERTLAFLKARSVSCQSLKVDELAMKFSGWIRGGAKQMELATNVLDCFFTATRESDTKPEDKT